MGKSIKRLGLFFVLIGIFAMFGLSAGAHAQGVPVALVNSRTVPIQVSFTLKNHTAGPITWGTNCTQTGTTVFASYATIAAGQTCSATVDPSAGSSRFCATLGSEATDCMNGQANHLTLVETTFQPASAPGCFGKGACVWYDISVIPATCTDQLWKKDQCKGTGGASYNLPVRLACAHNSAEPIYTCKGPTSTKYGSENYPSNCGNPNAKCATGTPGCRNGVSAYFYPMFDPPENAYQPNAVCLSGTFTAVFLPGN